MSYALSVDTGGTFTDGFVTGHGRSAQVKVDTTPADPTEGFVACVEAAAAAMDETLPAFLANATVVHFSSTIATNVVVQRAGAPVGLIVTAGQEKALYGSPQDAARLTEFIDADAVRGVAEAIGSDGTVEAAVDPAGLDAAVRELLERGVQLVVVSLAGAHRNPANEHAAKAMIEASYPRHYLGAIPLLLSSQISLHPDDHGRTALAVANAYLHPVLARRLYRAEDRLRAQKFRRPVLVVNTDGSSTRIAKTRAIDTFNSGPSAGVLGSTIVAGVLGAEHVVTFDVGGTTTDVAYVERAVAPRSDTTVFGEVALPHPAVALWSFGVGGGSIIDVADDSSLRVGPRSAGAVPGPACFSLGGDQVTPTDVWLALGYLEPGQFLSSRRQLAVDKARTALETLGNQLGMSAEQAALTALDAIHATLATELRTWAAGQPGLTASQPESRWLFSYGGGGGLLAAAAADALGIARVVVFPQSSVFSAFGGGLLPIAHTYDAAVPDVAERAASSRALVTILDRAGRDMRSERVESAADVIATITLQDFSGARRSVTRRWDDLVANPELELTLASSGPGRLSVSLRVATEPDLGVAQQQVPGDNAAPSRSVRFADGIRKLAVSPGLGHPHAADVAGPAFLSARDTTIFVPAGWTTTFNDLGYGILGKRTDHG